MAKELQDWIIPWIDEHFNKHGTDTSKVYRDGKKVQIIEFETYRNHADPNDKTQIVALATDSVHLIRLIFDKGMTNRFYKEKGYPITRDLRCLYRLKEYKIIIPPNLSPAHASSSHTTTTTTTTDPPPGLDPTYRPKTRPNLFTILVTQTEWYWGSSSEPNFCSSPIDVRLNLLGPDGKLSAYAQGYRDKIMARLKRREKRSRSRSRSVMSEREVERMQVFEEYQTGKVGKNEEEVRRDGKAVLEIFLEDARIRSIKGQQQGMGVIVEGEAGEEAEDEIEVNDLGSSPISPQGNSYEAPPFQMPQPNFSLSHPTPPTSSGGAGGSNNITTPTPTKTSARAQQAGSNSSPTKALSGSRRSERRRPEDDYDEDDPIVQLLLQYSEAPAESSSSVPKQPDPMEVYELLVKNQLEGRCVDWAFRPSERWVGGEEGLKRVLEGVKVFGLDLVTGEEEDDDDGDEKEEEGADKEEIPVQVEVEAEHENAAILDMKQAEEPTQSEPSGPSQEPQTNSSSQNMGKMMRRRRRTRSRERERGRSSEARPIDPSPQVSTRGQHVKTDEQEPRRSSSLVWETSPEPVRRRPRLHKPANTVENRTSVSIEATEFAEVIDGMLTSQSDEEEVQVTVSQTQVNGGTSRQPSADQGETSELKIQQAGPRKRPNVQRISLGSPSSEEEEEQPRPSVLGKRKASVDSPFIHQPAISEKERRKRQKLEEIRRLQEEVEILEAGVDESQVELLEKNNDQHDVKPARPMSVDSTRSASLGQVKDAPPPTVASRTQASPVERVGSHNNGQTRQQIQSGRFRTTPLPISLPRKKAFSKNDQPQATTAPSVSSRGLPTKATLLLPTYGLRTSEVDAIRNDLQRLLKGAIPV